MSRLARMVVAIASTLIAAQVFADCVDGVREATAREREFFNRVFAAVKDVLPATPPNWTSAPVRNETLSSLCVGDKEGDFSVRVDARYTYRMPKEQVDRNSAESRKLQAEIDALEKLPPEVAKERQGWMDKYSEATRAARQADKDGNKELAKQKYAERDGYDKQASAVRTRHLESIKPQVEPLRAKVAELSSAPVDVVVRIIANDAYPDKLDPKTQSEIVVGTVPAPKARGLKVYGVRAVIEGPAPRRDELTALIDKAKLERIVR